MIKRQTDRWIELKVCHRCSENAFRWLSYEINSLVTSISRLTSSVYLFFYFNHGKNMEKSLPFSSIMLASGNILALQVWIHWTDYIKMFSLIFNMKGRILANMENFQVLCPLSHGLVLQIAQPLEIYGSNLLSPSFYCHIMLFPT